MQGEGQCSMCCGLRCCLKLHAKRNPLPLEGRAIAYGVHHGGTESTEKRVRRAKRAILRFSVLSVPPWSIFPIGVSAAYAIALPLRGQTQADWRGFEPAATPHPSLPLKGGGEYAGRAARDSAQKLGADDVWRRSVISSPVTAEVPADEALQVPGLRAAPLFREHALRALRAPSRLSPGDAHAHGAGA